jgi:hypothetical protein
MISRTICKFLPALALVLAIFGAAMEPVTAQLLKPDVPKMDTAGESAPKKDATAAPLKGGVIRNDKLNRGGTLRSGASRSGLGAAGRGRTDLTRPLQSRLKNDRLESQIDSGIGIIGVKFTLFANKSPIINRVFPQTPAYKTGVQADDVIVAVDGVPTVGLSKEEVYDMIIGTPGTTVTLSLQHQGDYRAVTMTRMDLNDISDPFIRRDYLATM